MVEFSGSYCSCSARRQFVRDLVRMQERIIEIESRPTKKIHIHLAEKDKAAKPDENHVKNSELVARLEGRTPVKPPAVTLGTRLVAIESIIKSDICISAMKTTAAVRMLFKVTCLYISDLRDRPSLSLYCFWRPQVVRSLYNIR